jgi:hypothetical protein
MEYSKIEFDRSSQPILEVFHHKKKYFYLQRECPISGTAKSINIDTKPSINTTSIYIHDIWTITFDNGCVCKIIGEDYNKYTLPPKPDIKNIDNILGINITISLFEIKNKYSLQILHKGIEIYRILDISIVNVDDFNVYFTLGG